MPKQTRLWKNAFKPYNREPRLWPTYAQKKNAVFCVFRVFLRFIFSFWPWKRRKLQFLSGKTCVFFWNFLEFKNNAFQRSETGVFAVFTVKKWKWNARKRETCKKRRFFLRVSGSQSRFPIVGFKRVFFKFLSAWAVANIIGNTMEWLRSTAH